VAFIEPEEFRMDKLEELRRLGVDPYGRPFPDTRPLNQLVERFDELEGESVRAAGRITNKRDMGRASFMDIKDWTGSIQVFFQQKRLGEEKFTIHQQLDAGDIVGVSGELTRTRTGEKTIFVGEFTVLAKALLNPPEKWHGLRDQELRYRHRSLDLFTTDEVMEVFRSRSRIIRTIREFLQERGFVEVETPMMQTVAGGAAARPFLTHHNALDIPLYLRIAPELYLKRLLVGGIEKVFEINRNFRNEGISSQHNPEFTMLEVYEAYGSYETMMALTQDLVARAAQETCGSLVLPWAEEEIDLTPPWPRRPFWELVEEHLGLDRGDEDGIRAMAEQTQTRGAQTDHPDLLAYHLFEKKVEDSLQDPVFVIDYPKSISPLAKAKKDDPEVAERFELYMAGMELAPAYTELNDPLEQEQRFLEQVGTEEERQQIDREFVQALAWGMPPAGGLGIGIDRLVMILTDRQSIRDVILFPLLRPQEGA